jgi:hypothetical protein
LPPLPSPPLPSPPPLTQGWDNLGFANATNWATAAEIAKPITGTLAPMLIPPMRYSTADTV